MDTKILITLAVVVILGGGAFFFLNNNQSREAMMEKEGNTMMEEDTGTMMEDGAMKTDDAMMEKKDEGSMMEKPADAMTAKGSYEPYAASKLAMAEKGDVVLFFRASWCPTCRALDADIKAHLGDIPSGVTILDVDYDSSTALKQKYGVTHQHTLVQVDAKGNQIAKWDASPTLADLLAKVK
jgi:thiol-disulfide isomerase/thioredoxin